MRSSCFRRKEPFIENGLCLRDSHCRVDGKDSEHASLSDTLFCWVTSGAAAGRSISRKFGEGDFLTAILHGCQGGCSFWKFSEPAPCFRVGRNFYFRSPTHMPKQQDVVDEVNAKTDS